MQNELPMATLIFFSLSFFLTLLASSSSSSSPTHILTKGSFISVENPNNALISPNSLFTAGFFPVGNNAFCFAIWLTEKMRDGNLTVVWMANRDQPVNGKYSKLSLLNNGNLILTDAAQFNVWSTQTTSNSSVQLTLYDTANLVLVNSENGLILWQSFDFPTDTLLVNQPLTRQTSLVSSRSLTNCSSGFYKLFFDDVDNAIHLLFDSLDVSSSYWPYPWLSIWEAGRTSYNSNKTALFNSSGFFKSTDGLEFYPTDYGSKFFRRLTVDVDGNFRMYSLDETKKRREWRVTWQAISQPCKIHGICGANAMCTYVPDERKAGKRCRCIPGYKMKNHTDWSYGCEPDFSISCKNDEAVDFLELRHVEFYGYDIDFWQNYTLSMCKKECLQRCSCIGFQFIFDEDNGDWNCYPKSLLLNGHHSPGFKSPMYIKLPKAIAKSYNNTVKEFGWDCPGQANMVLNRIYKKPKENATLQVMVWFASSIGGIEAYFIFILWCFLYRTQKKSNPTNQGYFQVGTGFRNFTYEELKKATKSFSEEIGRGGGGVVYKGVLWDNRVAAIKRLNETNQGEAEFLAEVSTIGKLNHMNLIEMWGYCVEGKHRLLVYEYMDHGSLARNLTSNTLDSEKRFNIAVGTAKGLAYLHEECLEWVLHCDMKPQNVLLDSNFQPKVADFGLSKLFNRMGGNDASFSKIRGTRGYMAPEWIFNLSITAKVDVYSYGVVLLEMVTGKSPMVGMGASQNVVEMEQRGLVNWVREKMCSDSETGSGLEEIVDPVMKGEYDAGKMQILVEVALQCVEEDKDARPAMSQVVKMLLHHEEEDH